MKIRNLTVLSLALVACGAPPKPPPADPPIAEGAQSVFFLVRHAEKADQSEDPPLTEEGRARARSLAFMLREVGIERIYSSDFVRTRDTAAPLAGELGLEVTLYDPNLLPELAAALLSAPGRYLVVGHSNTTPELAGLLGGDPGSPISEDEYDRVYVIHHRPGTDATTLLLKLEPRQEAVSAEI